MRGHPDTTSKPKGQRHLRKRMPEAERRLWLRLKDRQLAGCKFSRQQPYRDYILDFACLGQKVAIQIDDGRPEPSPSDPVRDAFLSAAGFTVLRFSNGDVLQRIEAVLATIAAALPQQSHPRPAAENEDTRSARSP